MIVPCGLGGGRAAPEESWSSVDVPPSVSPFASLASSDEKTPEPVPPEPASPEPPTSPGSQTGFESCFGGHAPTAMKSCAPPCAFLQIPGTICTVLPFSVQPCTASFSSGTKHWPKALHSPVSVVTSARLKLAPAPPGSAKVQAVMSTSVTGAAPAKQRPGSKHWAGSPLASCPPLP